MLIFLIVEAKVHPHSTQYLCTLSAGVSPEAWITNAFTSSPLLCVWYLLDLLGLHIQPFLWRAIKVMIQLLRVDVPGIIFDWIKEVVAEYLNVHGIFPEFVEEGSSDFENLKQPHSILHPRREIDDDFNASIVFERQKSIQAISPGCFCEAFDETKAIAAYSDGQAVDEPFEGKMQRSEAVAI